MRLPATATSPRESKPEIPQAKHEEDTPPNSHRPAKSSLLPTNFLIAPVNDQLYYIAILTVRGGSD